jgi:sirohydrochlorin cobaltochelatase
LDRKIVVKKADRSALIFLCLTGLFIAGNATAEEDEHAGHQMSHSAVPEMDASGKRLDSTVKQHEMDDATLAALRKKIALYRALSDREARLNMALMGPNYEWYASDLELKGKVGVLVLSHGVGENSDAMFREALNPVSVKWPTAVSFGMAMMMSSHIQSAVDDLTASGADTIVLVPTPPTRFNTLSRQWMYAFGMLDESSYLDVPRVTTDARVIVAEHMDDHPLITEVLFDYLDAVSSEPSREVVIIVGHGPEDIEDNVEDLGILQAHVDRIKALDKFAEVKIVNLQDDAYPPIRVSNVKKLRRWIQTAHRKEQIPIVLTYTPASHGFQAHVRNDLRGLDYVFADRGISEHPNYIQWIQAAIEERLSAMDAGDVASL